MTTVTAQIKTARKSTGRASGVLIAVAGLLAVIVAVIATDRGGLTQQLEVNPDVYLIGP